jgi:hypothetical protein
MNVCGLKLNGKQTMATRKPKPAETEVAPAKKTAAKKAPVKKTLSPKEIATKAGKPYVNIVGIELDADNIGQGAFELDWNEFFIAQLIKSGYAGRDDEQIIDRWFQDVCKNVALETWEQYEAMNPRGVNRKDLGNGRSEIS